jgi:hypothetical protein
MEAPCATRRIWGKRGPYLSTFRQPWASVSNPLRFSDDLSSRTSGRSVLAALTTSCAAPLRPAAQAHPRAPGTHRQPSQPSPRRTTGLRRRSLVWRPYRQSKGPFRESSTPQRGSRKSRPAVSGHQTKRRRPEGAASAPGVLLLRRLASATAKQTHARERAAENH